MKKRMIALAACAAMVLGLVACSSTTTDNQTDAATDANVMSHAEFDAAAVDDEVTVITHVQAAESWWDNAATVYAQDEDGAYLLYNMSCTEEQYASLVAGTEIKVTGYKSEWSGEVEIADATFEVVEDGTSYIVEPAEISAADFADHLNEYVTVKGLTVVDSTDADGNAAAFLYDWDGSGTQGDSSVYFTLSDGTTNYSFNVRNYLCGADTDVYKAAEALTTGETVDVTCFVYWYEDAAQPRVMSISVQ